MIIGTIAFASGVTTLGLDVITDAVTRAHRTDVRFVRLEPDEPTRAQDVDVLFVSLYWWRDVYLYVKFLVDAGINPRKRSPILVIGGMSAWNPWCIAGYWNYAVIGDGEEVAVDLIAALLRGENPDRQDGLVLEGDREATFAKPAPLRAIAYREERRSTVARIEIARGCKFHCPFCKLSATKQYRELPFHAIDALVRTAKANRVAMFAPDRGSHSAFDKIPDMLRRYGKRDVASDLRLNQMGPDTKTDTVRFGLEAFTEAGRKKIKAIRNNERLHEYLANMLRIRRSRTDELITTATCYVIGDLPFERSPEIIEEFNEGVLAFLDAELERMGRSKFTMFLSVSSFCPAAQTPMERESVDPYTRFNQQWKVGRLRTKRLMVATRGAILQPAARLAQMITERGDERMARVVFWLATTTAGRKLMKTRGDAGGRAVEALVQKGGMEPELLYSRLDDAGYSETALSRLTPPADMPKVKKWRATGRITVAGKRRRK